jgi:hypothetical protein
VPSVYYFHLCLPDIESSLKWISIRVFAQACPNLARKHWTRLVLFDNTFCKLLTINLRTGVPYRERDHNICSQLCCLIAPYAKIVIPGQDSKNVCAFSGTSTALNMGYDPHLDGQGAMTSSGGTPTPTSGSGASRTSSSWTKQGVQVSML